MTDRLGSRGGSTLSFEHAQALMDERKPTRSAVVESAIWQVLEANGTFTADDLRDVEIPAGAENIIGNKVGHFARKGWIRRIGWQRSEAQARHAGENKVYELTDEGRAELRKLAGVGAGVPSPQGTDGFIHSPSCASTDPGESHNQPGNSPEAAPAGDGGTDDAPAGQLPLSELAPRRRPLQDPDDPLAA